MKNGYMVTVIILSILLAIGSQCRGLLVDEHQAISALETAGYSNVEIVDRDVFFITFRGGDENDAARFKARALNPAKKEVEVYVFVGWPFKGATVRGL